MSSTPSSVAALDIPSGPGGVVFSAEFQLLLACSARTTHKSAHLTVRSALENVFAWPTVIQLAEQHGVAPLLYSVLRDQGNVPAPVLEQLRDVYEHTARKNLKFVGELFRILDCLEAQSIPAIPLKGPALAERLFGDLAQRDFSDLDVMVPAREVARATAALRTLDYVRQLQFSEAEERAYLTNGYEYTFDGPAGRNLLEIQWNVLPRFYAVDFDCARFFERATTAPLAGRRVRTLCNEDLLLTLCVHAAKHTFSRLCWVRDIAAALQTQAIDWEQVERSGRKLGISRIVGVSLLLAHRLLGADVPDRMRELWREDFAINGLVAESIEALRSAESTRTESLDYFREMVRLRERSQDKIRFLYRLALTPGIGEWSAIRLPAPLFPLYRIVRLFRLMRRLLGPPADPAR